MTTKATTTAGTTTAGTGHAEVVRVDDLAAQLLAEARTHQSRRAAKTLVSGTSQRATVIAIAAGGELANHQSPSAATLHVLVGRVRLRTSDREWLLDAGDLVPVPPQRHGLDGVTDAAVLLTVALH